MSDPGSGAAAPRTPGAGDHRTAAAPNDGLDPNAMAKLIREVPEHDLEALMASDQRDNILREIFGRFAEHFRPDQARGLDAVVHFKILDRPGGGYDHYEVLVSEGALTVNHPPEREPTVTLKVKPVDFLKLVTNNTNGPMLFVRGRLKIDGDLMLASRLTGLFTIPGG
jgi:putative sterol carrier protein